MTPDDTFDRTPFVETRRALRDLLIAPVAHWVTLPPARRTETAYRRLTGIPLDLASAGLTVALSQTDDGWRIEIQRRLAKGATLRLSGQARSYVTALFQLGEQADSALSRLEKHARKAHREALATAAIDDEAAA